MVLMVVFEISKLTNFLTEKIGDQRRYRIPKQNWFQSKNLNFIFFMMIYRLKKRKAISHYLPLPQKKKKMKWVYVYFFSLPLCFFFFFLSK